MDFQPVKMPVFACDLPAPRFALIPTTPRNTDVITNCYRKGIHRIHVVRVVGLGSFRQMVKEYLKQRADPMKSAIVWRVSEHTWNISDFFAAWRYGLTRLQFHIKRYIALAYRHLNSLKHLSDRAALPR